MGELHRTFDLAAQDTHVKSERPSFTVVTASKAFRQGYDAIFATSESQNVARANKAPRSGDEPVLDSTPPRAGKEAP